MSDSPQDQTDIIHIIPVSWNKMDVVFEYDWVKYSIQETTLLIINLCENSSVINTILHIERFVKQNLGESINQNCLFASSA
jgi:hypothetical protein